MSTILIVVVLFLLLGGGGGGANSQCVFSKAVKSLWPGTLS